MHQDFILKLTLIFACIFLHFFNGAGLFYSRPFPEQSCIFNGEQIDFLEISAKASFLLRIVGACWLGKVADQIGFVKVMKIICLLNICAGLLLIFFNALNILEKGILLCLLRSLFAFLRKACFILPLVYIFRHYEKLKHYKYSAFTWASAIAGAMTANLCLSIFTHLSCVSWGMVYTLNSVLSFMIYNYVEAAPEFKIKKKTHAISKPAFLLASLLIGILGVGVSYQYFHIRCFVSIFSYTVLCNECDGTQNVRSTINSLPVLDNSHTNYYLADQNY